MLSWRAVIVLILLAGGGQASNNTEKCKLSVDNTHEKKALALLEPLTNKSFSVNYTDATDTYTYIFRVCDDAGGVKGAGLIQKDKTGKNTLIGSYTDTQAIAGSDWVMLIYKSGEKYDKHCSNEERRALIMMSCNRSAVEAQLSVIREQREKNSDCFYLFELDSSALCPVIPSKISTGSILLIIGFSCLTVYLIGGFLYQRLVVGAKGVEQFPNYAFWSEIGNLSADGCDFVCRSRGSREESPAYRGASTEPLEEPEERDDHLLPM
ncbi:cation-dependent mannose-6-phosphate receptor [Salminus brasiliensis]|uniref:cation-dependent mannose-6-phosphate receptor n=1 Tax=Salminus brasiliensis TaxID=930266 RepID=UPI003B835EB4